MVESTYSANHPKSGTSGTMGSSVLPTLIFLLLFLAFIPYVLAPSININSIGLLNLTSDKSEYYCPKNCTAYVNLTSSNSSISNSTARNITINNTASSTGVAFNISLYNTSISNWQFKGNDGAFLDNFNLSLDAVNQFRFEITLNDFKGFRWNTSFNVGGLITVNVEPFVSSINLTSPANNTPVLINSTYSFQLLTANLTTQNCNITINSSFAGNTTGSNASVSSLVVNFDKNGTFTWNVSCIGFFNDSGLSENRIVIVDSDKPRASSISPTSINEDTAIDFNATVGDTNGLACNLSINSTTNGSMTINGSGAFANRTVNFSNPGTYSLLANCSDNATNRNDTSVTVVTVADITKPAVSSVAPASVNEDVLTVFNVTLSDNVGVTVCNLTINSTLNVTMTINGSATYANASVLFATPGTYSMLANCTDSAGNRNDTSVTVVSVVDTTKPAVSSIAPINLSEDVLTTFNVTLSDNIGVTVCNLSVNNTFNSSMTVNGSATFANTTLLLSNPGGYSLLANCTDSAGNRNDTSATVVTVADTTAPNVTTIIPVTVNEDAIVYFNVSVSDILGVSSCTLYINGTSNGSMTIASNTIANRTVILSTPGNYSMFANCTDAAGNVNATSTTAVTANDITVPLLLYPVPQNKTYLTSVTAGYFEINMTDDSLNRATNVTLHYRRQGVGSYLTKIMGCNGTVPNLNCTITVDLETAISVTDGDVVQFYFNATDLFSNNALNGDRTTPLNATIDTKVPEVTAASVLYPGGKTGGKLNDKIIINATVTDAHSGLVSVTAPANGVCNESTVNLTSLGGFFVGNCTVNSTSLQGANRLNITAKDNAGLTNSSVNVTVNIDYTNPAVGTIIPTSVNEDALVNFNTTNISDNIAISACSLYINGTNNGSMALNSSSTGASRNVTFATPGTYALIANCSDAAGNYNDTSTTVVTVADITKPAVSTVAPASVNEDVLTVFNVTLSDNVGVTVCNLTINSTLNVTMTINGSATFANASVLFATPGSYSLIANCTDSAGNRNDTSVTVVAVADTTKPAVSTVAPTTLNEDVLTTFNVTLSDNIGVTVCNLSVNNTFNSSMTVNGSATFANTTVLFNTPGNYSLLANCTDSAGNRNDTSATVIAVADTTRPGISAVSPTSFNEDTIINFNATIADNIGVTACTLFVNGSNNGSMTLNGSSTGASRNVTFTQPGSYSLVANCTDSAGNYNETSTTATTALDITAPTVAIVVPNGNQNLTGTITINYTVTDNFDTNLNGSIRLEFSNNSGTNYSLIEGSLNNTGTYSWNASALNSSTVLVRVNATDDANNSATDASDANFTVDNTAPIVIPNATIYPGSQTWAKNTDTIMLTATVLDSPAGIRNVTVNASLIGCAEYLLLVRASGNTYNATCALSSAGTAVWNLTVNATDTSGNANITQTITVNADNTNPALTSTLITTSSLYINISGISTVYFGIGQGSTPQNFAVNGSASDTLAGLAHINFSTVLGDSPALMTASPWNATYNATSTDVNGIINISIRDNAFNLNYTQILVVNDSLPPTINVTVSPTVGTAGSVITITALVGDTLSGVRAADTYALIRWLNASSNTFLNIASVQLIYNGSLNVFNATYSTVNRSNGTYAVTVNATDTVSNVGTAAQSASFLLGFEAVGTSTNSSVSTGPTNQTTANSTVTTSTEVTLTTSTSQSNQSITLSKFALDPSGADLVSTLGATSAQTFVEIKTTINNSNLTSVYIVIHYNESALNGIPESQLGIYRYNPTLSKWQKLSTTLTFVIGTGVDITNNFVWANVTQLSLFAAAGDTNGPLTSQVALANNPVGTATTRISALVDDLSKGGSDISTAEFFVDVDPGNGNGTAMNTSDGIGFNGNTSEYVNATLQVSVLSEGLHYIYVRGKDAANNWGAAESLAFTVDRTPLTVVTLTSPAANASLATQTPTLSWQDLNNNETNYILHVDNDSNFNSPTINLTFGGDVTSYAIPNSTSLSSGVRHFWRVTAVDAAGNFNLTEATVRNFTVDVTGPSISSILNYSITNTSVTINWTTDEASDAQVEYGLVSTQYSLTTGLFNDSSTQHSIKLTGLSANTTYFYRLRSKDALGTLSISSEFNFTTVSVDTAVPTVNITAPASASTNNGIVQINFTLTDNSAVSSAAIDFDGANVWTSTGLTNYSWNTSLYVDGAHTIRVRATDSSGNIGYSESRLVYVNNADRVAPAISSVLNYSITNTSAIINWTTSESADAQVEYGLVSTQYSLTTGLFNDSSTQHSVTLSGLTSNRTYFYRVKSRDGAGNLNTSGEFNFTTAIVDTAVPTVNITAPASASTNNGIVQINFTLTDNSAVSSAAIDFDGANVWTSTGLTNYSWNTSLYVDGAHTIRVRATDSSGNIGYSESRLVYVNNADRVAPAISSVLNYSITNTSAIINWTTSESADAQVEYGLVSTQYSLTTGLFNDSSTQHSVTLSGLTSNRTYFYRVKSRDGAGNLNTSGEFSFTTAIVDTAVPTVNITAPASASTNNGIVQINFTLTDNSAVSSAAIDFDGANVWTSTGLTNYSWNTSLYVDGAHTIRVRATDSSGNIGYSESRLVYVNNADRVAPAISSVLNYSITTTTAIINWTTSESADAQVEYGLVSTQYSLTTGLFNDSSTQHSVTLSGLTSNRTYFYRVKSRDGAGNLNTSGEFSFRTTLDTTAPTMSDQSPSNGANVTDLKPTISFNITDDTSGVGVLESSIQIRVNGANVIDNVTIHAITNGFRVIYNPATAFSNGSTVTVVTNATDLNGNANGSSWSFTVGVPPPTGLSLVISSNDTFTTTLSVVLTINATNADTCRLSNDGSSWSGYFSFGNVQSWTLGGSSTSSGTRTVFFQCKTSQGVVSEIINDTIVYNPSTSGPILTLISPSQRYVNNNTININVSFVDQNGVNASSVNITVENNGIVYDVTSASTITGTGVVLPSSAIPSGAKWSDGDHAVVVKATNNASILSTSTFTFGINTFSPKVYGVSPTDVATTSNETPLINFKISPPTGGYASVDLTKLTVTIDSPQFNSSAPNIIRNTTVYTTNTTTAITCVSVNDGATGYYNCSLTSKVLLLGNHTIKVNSSDASGNRDVSFTSFREVHGNDTISVSVNPVTTTGYTWTFTFNVSTGSTAGNKLKFKIADWTKTDGTATIDVTGNAKVNDISVDNIYDNMTVYINATNSSTILTLVMTVPSSTPSGTYYTSYGVRTYDIDAAVVNSTTPTNGTYLSYVPVNVSANLTDSGSGVYFNRSVIVLLNSTGKVGGSQNHNDATTIFYNPSNPLADGNYTINVTPTDRASAQDESSLSTYSFWFVVDTTLPATLSLNGPANNTVSNVTTPTFNWTNSSDLNFDKYRLFLDTTTGFNSSNLTVYNITGVSNITFVPSTALTSDTTWYWYVAAVDKATNTRNSTQVFFIYIQDLTPPTVSTLVSPSSGTATNDTTPSLDWIDTNETNFANYTVQISTNITFGTVNQTITVFGITNSTINVSTALAQSTWFWRVFAYDSAGQSSNSSTFNFTVDTTMPTGAISQPSSLANISGTALIINGTTSDNVNVSAVKLSFDNSGSFTLANGTSTWTFAWTVPSGNDILVNITLWVNDTATNINASAAKITVNVDNIPPAPIAGLAVRVNGTTALNLTWTASSASDLLRYNIYRNTSSFASISGLSPVTNTTSVTYIDTGLTANTTYYYAITGLDDLLNENQTVTAASNTTSA